MSFLPLSRDIALRIGLAARELPDTDAKRLVGVLVNAIGMPITDEKLRRLTIKELRKANDGELAAIPMDTLKLAIRHLWGEDVDAREADVDGLPAVQTYDDGDMPGSIRVACCSNSGEMVDGHFDSCLRFLVYQVSPQELRLIDVRPTLADREAEDKNAFRADLVGDCQVLYVASIGGPAAAKVVRAGVHPVKLPQGGPAPQVLAELQGVLAGTPPPWLAKVMGLTEEARVRFQVEDEAEV